MKKFRIDIEEIPEIVEAESLEEAEEEALKYFGILEIENN